MRINADAPRFESKPEQQQGPVLFPLIDSPLICSICLNSLKASVTAAGGNMLSARRHATRLTAIMPLFPIRGGRKELNDVFGAAETDVDTRVSVGH